MFKSSSILLTYAAESHGKILLLSLTWVNHTKRFYFLHLTLESNFCFDLVCKVVVEVEKEFFNFHLAHG
jgi:hypothetical protein